jgi:5,5'-dehydrodivanillate O-demethylase
MLSEEENRRLTEVGPGTPMGELLRRYWHPICPESETEGAFTRPVRLLGEDLVLFRDLGGRTGLLSRYCAHRGSDLAGGVPEEYGLRCAFHGWLYDPEGRCLDQPLENEPFCAEIRLGAYAVETKAGLVWAYLGPRPAPLVPDWDPYSWDDALVQIVVSELACNWLQCQENSVEPGEAARDGDDDSPLAAPAAGAVVNEFDYGFTLAAPRQGAGAEASLVPTKTSLWPTGVFAGDERSCRFEWRVPVDDRNTLSIAWFADRLPPGASLPDKRVHVWQAPVLDERGDPIRSHTLNRLYALWLTQGRILDRTKEHLTEADAGISRLRERYFVQMETVADGGEPKGLVRDAARNHRLRLPLSKPQPDMAPVDFPYLAGQPADVAAAYRAVREAWLAATKRSDA